MATLPTLTELLKAGVHFGHKETKWHPKMAEYIFTVRNGIHVIDLEKTLEKLKQALDFLRSVIEGGGVALFVGTKPQARAHVREAADRVHAPYVTERWLGGTLTNFSVIQKLVKKLEDIEQKLASPEEVEAKYTKLERLMFERERTRLTAAVGGIRTLKGLPQVIILADVIHDETAVREARRKQVPTIALCDTNTNPEAVTYPIPANDEASRSIELLMSLFGKTIEEGVEARAMRATEAALLEEKAHTENNPEEEVVLVPDEIVVEAAKKAGLKEELIV